MNRIQLDTHIVIWVASCPEKLSPDAAYAEERADQVYISTISAWEIVMLQRKGRILIPGEPEAWIDDVIARMNLTPLAVSLDIARKSAALDYPGRDPADRFIIATALSHGLSLVTADGVIQGWGGVTSIW